MYAGLKKALCPSETKPAPLKSTTGDLIKDQCKQIDKWVEYYQDLYSRETTVAEAAIEGCWEEVTVPQDMLDANIIRLYKNKGERGDCNNYRGITLLSTVGKIFARVVLSRLQLLASRIYPESQCGFRRSRSAIDMLFSIRQLQEKFREQKMPLYMAFINLTKAFDLNYNHAVSLS
ncbi:uncharacterized protein LOC106880677 [Octopus bimaculoides]|uniref:uncharacterized protein LOC106880677 n=1 Tax=Octopus bimaculoides TaxID=37653 RepID=UPI0022E7361F|nr:uncharacterized protein LOC106880677 [Octopus bimaculoides]